MKFKFQMLLLLLLAGQYTLHAQTCTEREDGIDLLLTGERTLAPSDIDSSSATNTFTLDISEGGFDMNDNVASSIVIAGFAAACEQDVYTLIVAQTTLQNGNSQAELIINFRFVDTTDIITSWSTIKLTYLFVAQSLGNPTPIWTESVEVDPVDSDAAPRLPQTSIFSANPAGICGFDGTNFGINCGVGETVIVKAYISGFQIRSADLSNDEVLNVRVIPSTAVGGTTAATSGTAVTATVGTNTLVVYDAAAPNGPSLIITPDTAGGLLQAKITVVVYRRTTAVYEPSSIFDVIEPTELNTPVLFENTQNINID